MARQPKDITAQADELERVKADMIALEKRADELRAALLPEAEKRGAVFTSTGSQFAFVRQHRESLDTKAARQALGAALAPFMRETAFATLRYSPSANAA